MKLLVDMNLSPRWVGFLTEAGFEAVHWSAIGAADAPDVDLLRWAAENDHIVLTSDLDFGAVLAASRSRGPSVLQVRSDLLTPAAIGEAVLAAIRQSHQELRDGALISIVPDPAASSSARELIRDQSGRLPGSTGAARVYTFVTSRHPQQSLPATYDSRALVAEVFVKTSEWLSCGRA